MPTGRGGLSHRPLREYTSNHWPCAFTEDSVIQEDSYYPFGMQMSGLDYLPKLEREEDKNKYLYNDYLRKQIPLQSEFGLEWYDYGARFYDAQLGRFLSLDPIADKFFTVSPFNYTENSPISNIDT